MHAISSFPKLSKTIRQTSSNIPRQAHTPVAKASPIPSKSNARVQSQKINRTVESNLFKHSQTKFTYSQHQFAVGLVLDSIRCNRAIGIPFTILSTALNKRKETRVCNVIESNSRVRTFPSIDGVAAERIIADVWITKACQ